MRLVVRDVVTVVACLVGSMVISALHFFVMAIGATTGIAPGFYLPYAGLLAVLVSCRLAFAGYRWYARRVEHRETRELDSKGALRELLAGALIGAAFLSSVVGLLAALGYARIETRNAWFMAVPGVSLMATVAFTEELVFRGALFRILELRLGTVWALVVSAAVFGLIHAPNDNASWASTLNVAVTAGPLLAAAYVVTGRLWLATGLHFAWNAMQSVLGLPISGVTLPGAVGVQLGGPELLTGGAFGVEASLIVPPIAAAITLVMLWRAARSGRIKPRPRRGDSDHWKGEVARARSRILEPDEIVEQVDEPDEVSVRAKEVDGERLFIVPHDLATAPFRAAVGYLRDAGKTRIQWLSTEDDGYADVPP